MKYINVSEMKNYPAPPQDRVILCYCPDWCDTGYQAALWNGEAFFYDEEPNGDFHSHVVSYALFMEAD